MHQPSSNRVSRRIHPKFGCPITTASHAGTMSDLNLSPSQVAGPGFPRLALALAWLGSSLGTGVLGWVLPGAPGRLLLAVAALGLVATGAVVSNRHRRMTLTLSAIASTIFTVVGAITVMLAAATGESNLTNAVATGAVPVISGLLSYRLTRRAQRMAQ